MDAERRKAHREGAERHEEDDWTYGIEPADLIWLLDAADERDRLLEAKRLTDEQTRELREVLSRVLVHLGPESWCVGYAEIVGRLLSLAEARLSYIGGLEHGSELCQRERNHLAAENAALREAVALMAETFPAYAGALDGACSVAWAHGYAVAADAVMPFTEARKRAFALAAVVRLAKGE